MVDAGKACAVVLLFWFFRWVTYVGGGGDCGNITAAAAVVVVVACVRLPCKSEYTHAQLTSCAFQFGSLSIACTGVTDNLLKYGPKLNPP